MFSLFKKKETVKKRTLNHLGEIEKSDLITFKSRSILPAAIQDQTLTIKAVQAYQYDDGLAPEFVLQLPNGNSFTAMCSDEGEDTITLSKQLSHEQITTLFSADELGEIFTNENSATLTVLSEHIYSDLEGWLADSYFRTIHNAGGYFYSEDRRSVGASEYADDGSEELRYHECQGAPNHFSMSIEIWDDGSTDIFVQVTLPHNVIAEMWPHG
ncbi:MAG: hypothetical protein ACI9D5_002363 [Candidatus Endobugula sp.]|jgi:hypothetical protein